MDRISREQRSANMRRIRSKGMKPEMKVRRLLHALGYRFRVHRTNLPGTPDLVFLGRKKAIFVHGCFWHQHPEANCRLAHTPRSNSEYWLPKLERTAARDAAALDALYSLGWQSIVVWECELKDEAAVVAKLRLFLGQPGSDDQKARLT